MNVKKYGSIVIYNLIINRIFIKIFGAFIEHARSNGIMISMIRAGNLIIKFNHVFT